MRKERYLAAPDYEEYARRAEKNRELWSALRARAAVPDELAARALALPGRWHLLALSEDWCGDAVNTLPAVAALTALAPRMELRILGRDANPDLMDAHLTAGARSIPVVIAYDERFAEVGWWGPRPRALQEWFLAEGRTLDPAERYRRIRAWYARDRGRATVEEIVGLLEGAAARRVA